MAATGVPSVTSAGAPVRSGDLAGRTAFLSIRRPGRRRGAKIALAAFTYILALLSVPALASPASAAGGSTPPASTRYVAVGGQPPLPPGAHLVGSVPPNQVLHFDVVLQPRDPAGLARLATSVSTPGLPEYRKYLQKGAFARVFGPRASTISSVRDELRSLGLNVGSVSPNDLLVPVSATASHVQAALRIRMALFRLGGSRIAFANESAPSLPSDIAPDVLGIVGLNSLNRLVPLLQQGSMSPPQGIATHSRAQNRQVPSPHSSGPSPCSAAASTAQKNASYTDNEIAAAYGLTSLYAAGDLGAGETIGLPEFGGSVSTSDISTYESCLGVTTQVNQIPVDGGSTGSTNPEAELDIEDVIGLAPDATIDVYEAPNGSSTSSETAAILDDLNQIASDDAAQVVSYSYGYCESGISSSDLQAINTIFEQMASQGQSVFVASGDGGSESENVCNPPVPASISCSSSSSCMVVDTHGNAMAYDGKAWSTPEPFDTAGVPTSLSCPTTSFCVVVDTSGNALSYDGSSWSQPLNIDPSRPLTSVSCATTSFCMAVDVAGNALSYDGSSWSSTPIDPNGALVGVSCPSTGFCVAVDATGYSIFYENGAWGSPNQFAPGDTITSVACASSSVCMAGDKVGDIWTYADGNTQPWPMLSQGYVTSISCPSNDFCIAVDSVGGALKWNGFQWSGPTELDPNGGGFTSVSCDPAGDYCAAADAAGYVLGASNTATSVTPVLIDPAPLALTFPGSDPYVTSVGGTSMSAIGPPPSEVAWNDPQGSHTKGAGTGGISALSPMPSYQLDSSVPGVINQYSSAEPCHAAPGSYCREVPDVSASADIAHGYVVYVQGTWQPIGGTSAAAPTWASFVALSAESCGKRLGFVNPLLYGIAKAAPGDFHDITEGNNDLNDQHGGLYPATSGYDLATGLGSPNGSLLAPALCSFQASSPPPPPLPMLTSITPSSGTTAGGTQVTITGQNLSGATAVHFGGSPASDLQMLSASELRALSPPGSPGPVPVTVTTAYGTSSSQMTCADTFTYGTSPPSPAAAGYVAIAPMRVADTREGSGEPYAGQTLGACSTLEVQVAGVGSVPSGISAAVLNVTAVGPTRPGYLTVYPAGAIRPLASNLNFSAGEVVANLVEVPVSSSGAVGIFNGSGGDTNVVVDVEGYVPSSATQASLYTPITPFRVCDTRSGNPSGLSGPESQCEGKTLSAGVPLQVQVGGLGAVPSSASAVVLNLTVASPASAGYLTVYPASSSPPLASNVNFLGGETIANRAVVALPSSGAIDLVADATTDLVVDVSGYYSASGDSYTPLAPTRIADTRAGSGEPYAGQTLGPGGVLALQATGVGGVPAGAGAVVLNVTVTNTTASSYLTAYPAGVTRPMASDVNWSAGETLPNLVVVAVGSGGVVNLYNYSGDADLVVDVEGYYS